MNSCFQRKNDTKRRWYNRGAEQNLRFRNTYLLSLFPLLADFPDLVDFPDLPDLELLPLM
jgi:hypothetical protein